MIRLSRGLDRSAGWCYTYLLYNPFEFGRVINKVSIE